KFSKHLNLLNSGGPAWGTIFHLRWTGERTSGGTPNIENIHETRLAAARQSTWEQRQSGWERRQGRHGGRA
ncbi:hypothetical protein, partial [Sinorhizobium meliloti]